MATHTSNPSAELIPAMVLPKQQKNMPKGKSLRLPEMVAGGLTCAGVTVDGAFVAIASLPSRVRVMPVSSAATAVMLASMISARQSKEHPSFFFTIVSSIFGLKFELG